MARNRSWSRDVYESYPESDRRRRGRSYEDERRRALTAGPRLTDYGSPEYFAGAEPGRSGTYRGHDDSWERERAYGPGYFGVEAITATMTMARGIPIAAGATGSAAFSNAPATKSRPGWATRTPSADASWISIAAKVPRATPVRTPASRKT